MATRRLSEIEKEVVRMATVINAPINYLPSFGYSQDFARPHVEVDNNGYHYLIVERGITRESKTTEDYNELLYWIFGDVTSSMSWDYEKFNRKSGTDARRVAFAKQLELIGRINQTFRKKLELEIEVILKGAPYSDSDR